MPDIQLPETINKGSLNEIKEELGHIFDKNVEDTEFVIN